MDGRNPMDGRRCTAKARSGIRCRRSPIPGGAVCAMHGGKAPQVQRTAQQRLAALIDPALDAMERALRSRNMRAVVAAARDILDRTTGRAALPLKHSGELRIVDAHIERLLEQDKQHKALLEVATPDEFELMRPLYERLQEIWQGIEARLTEGQAAARPIPPQSPAPGAGVQRDEQ
jgi:hypothetical protein